MVFKIHGGNRTGAMQTGKGEVVRLYSAHHAVVTGLLRSRADLVDAGILTSATLSGTNSFTSPVTGVVYTVDGSYDRDLNAQGNLDRLVGAFAQVANPVYVDAEFENAPGAGAGAGTTGTAAATTLDAETPGVFAPRLTAVWGTDIDTTASAAWIIDLHFEQKGVFAGPAGGATIGAAADNYGSSQADIQGVIDGLVLHVTSAVATGGDWEAADDSLQTNTDGRIAAAVTAAALARDAVAVIADNTSGDLVTSTTVLCTVFVARELQS